MASMNIRNRKFLLNLNTMALMMMVLSHFIFPEGPGRMLLGLVGGLEVMVVATLVVLARLSGKSWGCVMGR